MFLSLLLNKYTWIALILGGLVLTIGVQRVEIRHLSSVIEGKDKSIGEFRASVAERDAMIEKQNLAVEGWKAAGVENARRAVAAEKAARQLAAKSQATTQAILQTAVPSDCPGAIEWLKSPSVLQSLSW